MMTAGSWIGNAFAAVVRASNVMASLWIVVLMVLMVSDVTLRYAFNRPIAGVNEILEISIVAMLYLQIGQALRDDRHTRSDAFRLRLMEWNPRAARWLDFVFLALGFVLMLVIVRATWLRLADSYLGGFTIGNRGVFIVPEWPLRAIILFGCTLMMVQFALSALACLQSHVPGPPMSAPSGDHTDKPA